MPVTATVQTTQGQDLVLSKYLIIINERRIAAGQAPYADVNAMAQNDLTELVSTWIASFVGMDALRVHNAYLNATPQQKAQVRTDLGLA